MAAAFADNASDIFLGMIIVIDQPRISTRLIHGVQIGALNILDQRQLQAFRIRYVLDQNRHIVQPRHLGRPPAPLSRNDFVMFRQIRRSGAPESAVKCPFPESNRPIPSVPRRQIFYGAAKYWDADSLPAPDWAYAMAWPAQRGNVHLPAGLTSPAPVSAFYLHPTCCSPRFNLRIRRPGLDVPDGEFLPPASYRPGCQHIAYHRSTQVCHRKALRTPAHFGG